MIAPTSGCFNGARLDAQSLNVHGRTQSWAAQLSRFAPMIDLSVWKQPCGTIHCALSLACTLPEFNVQELCFGARFAQHSAVPTFGVEYGFMAAAEFFGNAEIFEPWISRPSIAAPRSN